MIKHSKNKLSVDVPVGRSWWQVGHVSVLAGLVLVLTFGVLVWWQIGLILLVWLALILWIATRRTLIKIATTQLDDVWQIVMPSANKVQTWQAYLEGGKRVDFGFDAVIVLRFYVIEPKRHYWTLMIHRSQVGVADFRQLSGVVRTIFRH